MSRTQANNRRPPCSNWLTRTSTGKEVPSLAPVAGLESDRFPGDHALLQALDGRIVETDVEIALYELRRSSSSLP